MDMNVLQQSMEGRRLARRVERGGDYTWVKKGEGRKVEEYREVTLMTVLYKIYMMVLAERVRKECEGKGMIPQNQTGFRKGMGTLDNI